MSCKCKCKGAVSSKGPKGDQGEQGIQGPQGEKGDQGDEGPQGIQGDPGADGADGADGLDCDCTFSAEISADADELTCTVTGGTSPYDFTWETAQASNLPAQASGGTQTASPASTTNGTSPNTTTITAGGSYGGYGTNFLWRCKVVDADGCITYAYWLHTTPGT